MYCFMITDACLVPLRECEAVETIGDVLKDKRTLPEILCNCLTLTKYICSNGKDQVDGLCRGHSQLNIYLYYAHDITSWIQVQHTLLGEV